MRFSSGRVLHSHMQMHGTWRVLPVGATVHQPVRIVLETESCIAVCRNAPTVELLAARSETVHPWLSGLGPDILSPALDVAAVVARARSRAGDPDREIADLLLDQQVVCGIGNIWRSETLFVVRVFPGRLVRDIDDDTLERIIEAAARLMSSPVRTRWVYRRARQPCRRCGTLVKGAPIGGHRRTAYWCPACQRA
jgi:endonuclease-8